MKSSLLIKTPKGFYKAQGNISEACILETAAEILLKDLSIGDTLDNTNGAAKYLQLKLAKKRNEHFAALFLDTQHHVIAFEVLFKGTIDGAAVYPRVVVQKSIEHNAAAIIFAHNHPSNHTEPSHADKAITKTLIQALALIDVRVLDHFIVGKTGWLSFADRGYL